MKSVDPDGTEVKIHQNVSGLPYICPIKGLTKQNSDYFIVMREYLFEILFTCIICYLRYILLLRKGTLYVFYTCKLSSKISFTPKGGRFFANTISCKIELHSISSVANLLAQNNKSQICHCGQISLQSALMLCMDFGRLNSVILSFLHTLHSLETF